MALVSACVACERTQEPNDGKGFDKVERSAAPSSALNSTIEARPNTKPLPRAERRTIVAGELRAGTHPGEFVRNAALEPLPFRVKLGEFEIDALPFPNDPNVPAQAVGSVEEAGRLCGEKGARLCTELEWERACRGPEQRTFAASQPCAPEAHCESGFGVYGLGAQTEWTASHFGTGSPEHPKPVVRGQPAGGSTDQQRCGFRSALVAPKANATFHCCHGAPNAARVTEPTDYAVFESINLPPARVRELLESDTRTKDLAKELTFFADPEATNTVLSRGPGDRQGFGFSTGPLLWSPTFGARYLILAAKSGKQLSFVLGYHVLGQDEYALATSYVMEDEVGPVVFAYSPSIRPRMHFSTCWGCPGETGKVLSREDGIVILQP